MNTSLSNMYMIFSIFLFFKKMLHFEIDKSFYVVDEFQIHAKRLYYSQIKRTSIIGCSNLVHGARGGKIF